jgi:hypothetical protein
MGPAHPFLHRPLQTRQLSSLILSQFSQLSPLDPTSAILDSLPSNRQLEHLQSYRHCLLLPAMRSNLGLFWAAQL